MKYVQVGAIVGGVGLTALGIAMAMTNPNPAVYNAYAFTKLTELAKANCQKIPLIKKSECLSFLNSYQNQIQKIISQKTDRQDFIFFSIYTTHLSIPFLFSCDIKTLGIFQNLYTYSAENNSGRQCFDLGILPSISPSISKL